MKDQEEMDPKQIKKKKKQLKTMVTQQFAAKIEDDHNQEQHHEYLQIRKETYRICISNKIFYQKIGKYPQIMDLFKLIGFRRVSNQTISAFNIIKDGVTEHDLDK